MDIPVFEKLLSEKLIREDEFAHIQLEGKKPLSVHWDLRTLLYLGIVLITTGTGVLVYKNIDSIGHDVIIISIAVVCAACFGWCLKNSKGYSNKRVESPNLWFDYILLLGCLLLLTFIGYIQFQYNVFGTHWGLAAFIPMLLLFITAYYFDHLGVLSLAITNLATWLGITVTPTQVLRENDFGSSHIIFAGLLLGTLLVAMSLISTYKNIKAHFAFTFKNFGIHILFISLLALTLYYSDCYLLVFILFSGVSFLFFKKAIKEQSFYFLVITLLYAYIGLSYVVIRLLSLAGGDLGPVYAGIIYFIASGIFLIRFFIHYNKILKKDAGI